MAGPTITTTARSSNPSVLLTDAKVASIKPPAEGQEEHRDLKVTGLRLRIGAGGKKTWIVRARAGQKILNKRLGHYPAMGVADARTAAEKLLTAVQRDKGTESIDRTFGSVAEAWIEKVAKPKNRSWKLQERRLELHVLPKWRDRKIAEIRRSEVRDLIEGLEGDVLPNMVLALVRPIFRFALSRDWIEASPAEGIQKPKPDTPRDRKLSMDEVVRIWRATEHLGYPFRQYVQTLLLTGQRRTEVASMRWDAVDLDAGTWALEASETKSKRDHLVPLSKPVVERLKAMPKFGGFLFSTDGETHLSGYAKVKRKLEEFMAAEGEPIPGWTFHDFRRAAATHMVRLGISEEAVGKVLNHASQGVTARHYNLHSYADQKRDALDRWAAEVMRLVAGKPTAKVIKLKPVS